MYELSQVPYETKVVSIGVGSDLFFKVASGLKCINTVLRPDNDQTSSSRLLASQETCTGCEYDNQMSAILFCSLSVLQVRQVVNPKMKEAQAHIHCLAIYYEGADTAQIPDSYPVPEFLVPVGEACNNVSCCTS